MGLQRLQPNRVFLGRAALCYGPLRFEEVNLERYGYGCCHVLQPFVSAAHFAGSLVSLPYNIVNRPCWECIAPLGHYRPGSPVPYRKIWPEWNPLAAAGECGMIAGLILLIRRGQGTEDRGQRTGSGVEGSGVRGQGMAPPFFIF